MKPELLPYKFKSLKFPEQHSEKSIVQLGWKARKYIRWNLVHIDNDSELLKKFGDLAVDDKVLDLDLYPRFNEILLNTQYWRLDKENWSIEPEHEASWDQARGLAIASHENPKLILSYLNDYFDGLESISDDVIYNCFQNILITNLVLSVKNIPSFRLSVSEASSSFTDILKILLDKKYNLEEFESLNEDDDLLDLFGLPPIEKDDDLMIECFEAGSTPQVVIVGDKLSQTKLYTVEHSNNLITIKLNTNNEFIKFCENDNKMKSSFTRFLKVYVQTLIDNPAIEDKMMSFHSYLAMNLNSEFQK